LVPNRSARGRRARLRCSVGSASDVLKSRTHQKRGRKGHEKTGAPQPRQAKGENKIKVKYYHRIHNGSVSLWWMNGISGFIGGSGYEPVRSLEAGTAKEASEHKPKQQRRSAKQLRENWDNGERDGLHECSRCQRILTSEPNVTHWATQACKKNSAK
jgi:hypothetical protein